MFIAYYGDEYGLTMHISLEDAQEDVVLIQICASKYHD